MRIILRHFFLASLPLVFGIAAGWGFAFSVPSCGRLVGPVFGPKCHWKQLEYQIQFHMAGVAFGCLLAATLGASMELRRRRAVQRATSTGGTGIPIRRRGPDGGRGPSGVRGGLLGQW